MQQTIYNFQEWNTPEISSPGYHFQKIFWRQHKPEKIDVWVMTDEAEKYRIYPKEHFTQDNWREFLRRMENVFFEPVWVVIKLPESVSLEPMLDNYELTETGCFGNHIRENSLLPAMADGPWLELEGHQLLVINHDGEPVFLLTEAE